MRRLGAILAGGASRRFDGDKAAALLDGKALIDHVADGLRPQVDALIVAGRDWPGILRVDDAPEAGLGPLGGLCGALEYAKANGFALVVSHPCDLLPVPDWSGADERAPAFAAGHYVAGVWPAGLSLALAELLREGEDRSVRSWIARCGARAVECGPMEDLNTRAALDRYHASPRDSA